MDNNPEGMDHADIMFSQEDSEEHMLAGDLPEAHRRAPSKAYFKREKLAGLRIEPPANFSGAPILGVAGRPDMRVLNA